MKAEESAKICDMTSRLIAFILWQGADFESKKKKVLRELYQIKDYCKKRENQI